MASAPQDLSEVYLLEKRKSNFFTPKSRRIFCYIAKGLLAYG